MIICAAIFVILFVIEIIFRPRLDITREKELLLWYGKSNRKYTSIIKF